MLFAWANKKLEQLAETIAPMGADSNSLHNKFLVALTHGNEDLALAILRGEVAPEPNPNGEPVVPFDAANTIFNNSKGNKAIHVACQYCAARVIHALINDYRISIDTFDYLGNTGLHYAAAANHSNVINVVKSLVQNYNATVTIRNANNQTPYDVSADTLVRQYLLPLQLQRETQDALDSGGPLPPGTDISSHRAHISQQFAKNNAPPTMPGAPAAGGGPPPPMQYDANIVSAPPSLHSQLGGTPVPGANNNTNRRMIPNDGFHSSASDPNLQRKYGHVSAQPPGMSSLPPPPPVLGGGAGAAGATGYTGGRIPTRSKYLAYDAVTGVASSVPTSTSSGFPPPPQQQPQQTFNPNNIPQQQQFQPPPAVNNFAQQQQPIAVNNNALPSRPPPMHMNSSPPAMTTTTPQPVMSNAPSPQPMMNNAAPSPSAAPSATVVSALPPPPQMNKFTPPSTVAATAAATAGNVFSTPPAVTDPTSATATSSTTPQQAFSSPPPAATTPAAAPVQSSPNTSFPPPPVALQSSPPPAANFFSPPSNNNASTSNDASNVFSSPPSNT